MKRLSCIILLALLFTTSYSQIDDIPIDNSESPGSYDKMAITTSLKSAYPLAPWLNDFDKYVSNRKEITKLSEVSTGFYHIMMKSYCVRPGMPVGGTGAGTVLGPLKGKKSKVIREIIFRAVKHPEIEQKYVQTLIWGIIAGIAYSDYPKDFKKKIDPLLSASEKKESGIKFDDLLELIPDDIKSQLGILNDIRSLVKEGINRYEDLERVAVPPGEPIPSSKDISIEPGQWTLFEDGSYIRANPIAYNSTPVEIYKPGMVDVSYDTKGRITRMESPAGSIECEYDDSEGADVITRPGGDFKINRIRIMRLNGKDIDKFKDALWTIPYDNKSSNGYGYNRIFDPPVGVYEEREKAAADFIESVKEYNTKKKLSIKHSDILAMYELKQFELCIKWMADNPMLPGEEIAKLTGIGIDASLNKISEVVYKNKLSSGGLPGNAPQIGGLVVMFGADGSQNTAISPDEDPPENLTVSLHNVNCDIIPAPGVMYTARLEILNNTGRIEEIVFDLYDISTEKGRYLNDKEQRENISPDIVFEPALCPGYEIIRSESSPNWFIATGSGASALEITVKCNDYGAFAKLKARVKIDGITHNAIADGFGTHINIPCDNDNDHIADKWENDNGVSGLPADWDEEDNPAGQRTTGDGMTIYEEYRGFYELLPEGTPQHVRLDPNKKEIFAIDDDFMLSTYSWENASGIPVYRVNEAFVYGTLCGGDMAERPRYRLVNFCAGYSPGIKYAVNVVKINGLDDPYDLCGADTTYDGCSQVGPPVNANVTIVLPDRSRRYIESVRATLQRVYDGDPTSLLFYVEGEFIDRETMLLYLNVLTDPRLFELFIGFYVNTCTVHEVGHACGMIHHRPETGGDQDCPMRYYEYSDPLKLFAGYYRNVLPGIIEGSFTPIVALGTLHFCVTGDNCWNQITVNDRRP
jgi:hypothetical protein